MTITVQLFGPAAQAVGRSSVALDIDEPASTCAMVRSRLGQAEPKLAPLLTHCRLAVNHSYAADDQIVEPADEVALIGMVSGG
jgi:molybdopterin synthase catalytic subunit